MSNTYKLIAFISFSLVTLFNSSCVSSKIQKTETITQITSRSLLNEIENRGKILVGTTGDFMPFSYQSKSSADQFQGVDIELAKDLAESLQVDIEFVQTSWSNMMTDLKNNSFDICMSGVTIKLDRQRQALFSIPLLSSGKAAITKDENAQSLNSIDAINNKNVRVIVNPGGTNESFARMHFPNAKIILNEDNLSIFQKIVDGEADIMVTDAIETQIQELIHPELEAVNPDEPFNFFQMGYLLPLDHTFKAYIDQWLNLRQHDGTYDKIFNAELNKIKNEAKKTNARN